MNEQTANAVGLQNTAGGGASLPGGENTQTAAHRAPGGTGENTGGGSNFAESAESFIKGLPTAGGGSDTASRTGRGEGTAHPDAGGEGTGAFDKSLRKREYEECIRRFKDLDDARLSFIIGKRFRDHKSLQDELSRVRDTVSRFTSKFGIDCSDLDGINAAIEKLSLPFEVSPEEQEENILRDWEEQSEKLKLEYPDFDFELECRNPSFRRQAVAGIPLADAYFAAHREELLALAEKKARLKPLRPQENGLSPKAPFAIKEDVSNLTKKERAEAVRRANAGAKISF